MSKFYCNPINVPYRYQFNADPRRGGQIDIGREAADPSMIEFKGRYYIFPSMNLSVWRSDDLVSWEEIRLPEELPLYDYAPDVRVLGGYVYFSASSREQNCDFYRTKDIENGPYERIPGTFPFWDPNLFVDEDGKVYFYWGCSNMTPIYGVEMDPETMHPKTEPIPLVFGHPETIGYERFGEDHSLEPATEEEIDAQVAAFAERSGRPLESVPEEMRGLIRGMFARRPFIEGAWVTKHNGRYYLQYAFPGTEFNTYGDGVYVSDSPLGPYELGPESPYSYKPGGFIAGAGHGSTMDDKAGNVWHVATGRISKNFSFERRVGIWPAGFDDKDNLFCNTRFGDWPIKVTGEAVDPWALPEYTLLSYGKKVAASSSLEGRGPENAVDEDIRTWWRAATDSPEEYLSLDLGKVYDVRGIQVNFADEGIDVPVPGKIAGSASQARYIDETVHPTRYLLEGSVDGENWIVLEDKRAAETDLPHDFLSFDEGVSLRYVKLSHMQQPHAQNPTISGLRVFGPWVGEAPAVPSFDAVRTAARDMEVTIRETEGAMGYNILFGSSPETLYHCWQVMGAQDKKRIGSLIEGREYYVRVDAFGEGGVTQGPVVKL